MRNLPGISFAIALSAVASSAARAQDVAAGKSSFNKCLACHAIGEGAKNKVGPELNGLDGRKSGTAPDAAVCAKETELVGEDILTPHK